MQRGDDPAEGAERCLLRGRQIAAAPRRSGSSGVAPMQDVSCAARPSRRPKEEIAPLSRWSNVPRPALPKPPAACEAAWLDSQRAWIKHAIEDPVVVQGTSAGGERSSHAAPCISPSSCPSTPLILTSSSTMQAPPGAARCTSLACAMAALSIPERSMRW
jgi:hypothetical protein